MTNMTVSEIQHTAYHEAGHAVAACLVRRAFASVSIVQDEDSLGRVLFAPYGKAFFDDLPHGTIENLAMRRKVESEIITAYGGEAATLRLTGEPEPVGAAGDRGKVADFVILVTGSMEEAEAYGNWLWCRTKAMLASPRVWPAVEAVVEALLDRQTLRYRATRKIVRWSSIDAIHDHLAQLRSARHGQGPI